MRAYITLTFLLITFQIIPIIAQDFAPIGAEWYYNSSARGLAPSGSEYYYLFSEKDTSINHYDLRKIKRMYCNYQGDSVEVSPYLIHQDGDTVSLYDQDRDRLYKLLVFNASPGDTLLLDVPYHNHYTNDTTYRVIIDTVITESYSGVELDKYMLEQIDEFGWFNGFYLEKVGGYEWFFPLGKTIIPEADGPVRCYHDSGVSINFSTRPCDYRLIQSINNVAYRHYDISPNPASDFTEVIPDRGFDKIELLNSSGRVLFQTSHSMLNLSSLPAGIYFVKIYSGNNTIVKKLIKK
mgnify:CR=1 FL=1